LQKILENFFKKTKLCRALQILHMQFVNYFIIIFLKQHHVLIPAEKKNSYSPPELSPAVFFLNAPPCLS